ncbi:phytoene synthase [Pseudonocardia thermophila]|uniref:Phytoene synthase n=1 Tax=Pseudonocardia thermophila TaxID=1848 RepID=A0A1M6VX36_PSETH|nr:phytoene/squalene synthase family protein [Pseudonocardia thermophila]SHK86019.1 phytoene synthase [Pseudonocardia thermophila]
MPSSTRAELAELRAAGVTDPQLQRDYLSCRALFAQHGRTYFLATRLLPPARRPAVHALYGFARYADEVVDDLRDTTPREARRERLDALDARLQAALAGGAEGEAEPVVRAVAHTAARYGIAAALFADFMASMRMDLTVTGYADLDELGRYMHGSAAVIGLQMLPVLGTVGPRADAEPAAAALGVAFQLTNFLRDVGEDLDRGRVYVPADILSAHGVDRELLAWCRRTERTDPRVQAALRELAAHTHGVYEQARPGIALLEPVSRACVGAAFVLYRRILHELERAGYPLHRRVSVSTARRAVVAGPALARAILARARAR